MRSARFIAAIILLGGVAAMLQARGRNEVFPPREPLKAFPMELGSWTATELPLDKETLEILGPGDFIQRFYRSSSQNQPPIELFLAYFPSQRAGDTIHSPKHCLPGAGWTPVRFDRVPLSAPDHRPFPVNRYVFSREDAHYLVLYWFWAHDRGVASEYWAKYYLVKDAMKMNRSDGALVRIISGMYPGETADAAENRLMPFISEVVPRLNDYIPR